MLGGTSPLPSTGLMLATWRSASPSRGQVMNLKTIVKDNVGSLKRDMNKPPFKKGTQEPKKGSTVQNMAFLESNARMGGSRLKAHGKGPNAQSAQALQGLAGLGHLGKTGQGSLYCCCHYSEDKESTSASSTFISFRKQRHTRYN